MRYLSLFSGIGGFELGIQQVYEDNKNWESIQRAERGSIRPEGNQPSPKSGSNEQPEARRDRLIEQPENIGFSEVDKYAIQIYQKHFPEHKNYGDITQIQAKELPDFDLVVGGFPCPSFSIAGKRKGLEDVRGQLVFDIIRILRAKKPRMFLLENVKGLLSHDGGRTMEIICEELCESGYAIDFEVLNSKDFGVPQNRERVFIVGKRIDTLPSNAIY